MKPKRLKREENSSRLNSNEKNICAVKPKSQIRTGMSLTCKTNEGVKQLDAPLPKKGNRLQTMQQRNANDEMRVNRMRSRKSAILIRQFPDLE